MKYELSVKIIAEIFLYRLTKKIVNHFLSQNLWKEDILEEDFTNTIRKSSRLSS
ncbi:MAG: hypothetical protein K9M99_03595 [Candidatus Cloacimonetes bacterium]|nr:hypothetical protein [Candidatus Cloacimonadota bacterium]